MLLAAAVKTSDLKEGGLKGVGSKEKKSKEEENPKNKNWQKKKKKTKEKQTKENQTRIVRESDSKGDSNKQVLLHQHWQGSFFLEGPLIQSASDSYKNLGFGGGGVVWCWCNIYLQPLHYREVNWKEVGLYFLI